MLPPRLLTTMHTRVSAKVTWKTASSRSSTLFPLAGARYSTSMAPEGWDSPRKCSYTPYSTRFTPRRVPLRFCVPRHTEPHWPTFGSNMSFISTSNFVICFCRKETSFHQFDRRCIVFIFLRCYHYRYSPICGDCSSREDVDSTAKLPSE